MAIIKCGGGVTGIRGMLGGNVFSANINGQYARTWTPAHNPKTLSQTINRMYAGTIPTLWHNLSDGQRTDWNDYGKAHVLTNPLNELYKRNGFQWFFHCCQNLMVVGGTPPTDAPTDPAPATIDCATADYDDGGLLGHVVLNFAEHAFDGYWLVFMFYPKVSTGVMSCPSNYALLRGDNSPAGTSVNGVIKHNQIWGTAQLGWRGFFRAITMDYFGLRSAPWATSADFAAI